MIWAKNDAKKENVGFFSSNVFFFLDRKNVITNFNLPFHLIILGSIRDSSSPHETKNLFHDPLTPLGRRLISDRTTKGTDGNDDAAKKVAVFPGFPRLESAIFSSFFKTHFFWRKAGENRRFSGSFPRRSAPRAGLGRVADGPKCEK